MPAHVCVCTRYIRWMPAHAVFLLYGCSIDHWTSEREGGSRVLGGGWALVKRTCMGLSGLSQSIPLICASTSHTHLSHSPLTLTSHTQSIMHLTLLTLTLTLSRFLSLLLVSPRVLSFALSRCLSLSRAVSRSLALSLALSITDSLSRALARSRSRSSRVCGAGIRVHCGAAIRLHNTIQAQISINDWLIDFEIAAHAYCGCCSSTCSFVLLAHLLTYCCFAVFIILPRVHLRCCLTMPNNV